MKFALWILGFVLMGLLYLCLAWHYVHANGFIAVDALMFMVSGGFFTAAYFVLLDWAKSR